MKENKRIAFGQIGTLNESLINNCQLTNLSFHVHLQYTIDFFGKKKSICGKFAMLEKPSWFAC
jgi:hypothetical protein